LVRRFVVVVVFVVVFVVVVVVVIVVGCRYKWSWCGIIYFAFEAA